MKILEYDCKDELYKQRCFEEIAFKYGVGILATSSQALTSFIHFIRFSEYPDEDIEKAFTDWLKKQMFRCFMLDVGWISFNTGGTL